MAIPRLFKSYKPKQFTYIPRFYDERKEALKDRISQIKNEMGIEKGENEEYKPAITRGSMKRNYSERRKAERGSAIRLLIIIGLLLALAYYLLYL